MKVHEDVWRVIWFSILILVLWVVVPNSAHAYDRWNDHQWRDRDHYYRGHYHYDPVVVFPGKYLTITIGGERYYRSYGRYYRRHHGRYIEVGNPYAVIVTRIPLGCRRIYRSGRVYYTNNDVY
ncbi:MAG: hypothetical protein JNN05_09475, partial [Candidatus Omnitrophica bacterium]|nr:hypothetical protein [Candidatus Omnitrophota bacterium]